MFFVALKRCLLRRIMDFDTLRKFFLAPFGLKVFPRQVLAYLGLHGTAIYTYPIPQRTRLDNIIRVRNKDRVPTLP